jgi:hypothetical protein
MPPMSSRPIARALLLLAACLTSAALAAPLHAQANPFVASSGPYRAIRVTYATAGSTAIGQATAAMDLVVSANTIASRTTIKATVNGRPMTQQIVKILGPDSTWDDQGVATPPPTVNAEPRGALAREFDALDAASKRRLLDNLRRLPRSATEELDVLPSAIGTRRGSSTVAGQACDEYDVHGDIVCVLPRAPAVALRMVARGETQALSATKVVLDAAVTPAELRPPVGRRWTREPCGCAWLEEVWFTHGHENATAAPPLRELARFAVRWLASAEATKELAESADEEQP